MPPPVGLVTAHTITLAPHAGEGPANAHHRPLPTTPLGRTDLGERVAHGARPDLQISGGASAAVTVPAGAHPVARR